MRADLDGFLPITRIRELHGLLKAPRLLIAAAGQIAQRATYFTGFDLGFRVPDQLRGEEPRMWDAFVLAEKLKRLGWADTTLFLQNYPDEPPIFIASVRDSGGSLNTQGSGFHFSSRELALRAALGETIERYALVHFEPHTVGASYEAMKGQTFDLRTLAGIHPDRRHESSGRSLRFTDESIFRWASGRSLITGRRMFVPLQLVKLEPPSHTKEQGEPLLRPAVSTGAAAHPSLAEAQLSGTLELIEREAFMITWMNKLSPDRIRAESLPSETFAPILRSLERYGLNLTILRLPTDFPVHVVLAILTDDSDIGPALALGASARFSLSDAIERAIAEAVGTRRYIRWHQEHSESKSNLDPATVDREDRLVYWADKRQLPKAEFLFGGKEVDFSGISDHSSASATPRARLDTLVARCRAQGIELLAVDLLSRAIKKELRFEAVMMFSPQLQPMHLYEELPYNWGARLDSVLKALGLTPLAVKNKDPHPFP
jgi:ribosomal protein S12 methylthiotransferase accessory factor